MQLFECDYRDEVASRDEFLSPYRLRTHEIERESLAVGGSSLQLLNISFTAICLLQYRVAAALAMICGLRPASTIVVIENDVFALVADDV